MAHPFQEADQVFAAEMPSRLEDREGMIRQVLGKLEEAGCRPDPFFDRLSLDEILSNAVLHGNRQDPAKVVRVRVFRSPDRWGVEVADQGEGFRWQEHLQRLELPLDQSMPSGRGLALILSSGAELHFLDGGRRVVMTRKLPPDLPGR